MLIWPDGPCYEDYRLQMMCFNIYLAFIQYLQFAYQRGVLYRLRSLGERSTDMDITIDGFHSWMFKGRFTSHQGGAVPQFQGLCWLLWVLLILWSLSSRN